MSMKGLDRDTLYTGIILAHGFPPKPGGVAYSGAYSYSNVYRDWQVNAEHALFTALYDRLPPYAGLERVLIFTAEKQKFYEWISTQLAKAKLKTMAG